MTLARSIALVAALVTPPLIAQEPLVPATELRGLDALAKSLAKTGRQTDVRQVLGVLRELGYPQRTYDTLQDTCTKALAKGKPGKFDAEKSLKMLDDATAKILAVCEAASGDAQRAIALQLAALDQRNERVQQILGRVRAHGRWIDPAVKPLLDRQIEIQDAAAKARALSVGPSRVTQSDDELIEKTLGQPGVLAAGGGFTVHTTLSRAAIQQVMVDYMRASAFANYLLTGKVEPIRPRHNGFLFVDSRERYAKLLEVMQAEARMPAAEATQLKKAAFFYDPRTEYFVMVATDPSDFTAYLLSECLDRLRYRAQQFLRAGLANYVSLTMLGRRMTLYTPEGYVPEQHAKPKGALARAERGMVGLDALLADLVRRKKLPAWRQSFVADIGDIRGENLAMCTAVMRVLCAEKPIDGWLSKCHEKDANDADARAALFEKEYGGKVADLESRVKQWARGDSASMAERLEVLADKATRKARIAFFKQLQAARKNAFGGKEDPPQLTVHETLSRDATAHARYVAAMGADAKSWVDAHVEDPAKPEFSIYGMRSGPNCIVARGVDSPTTALDRWLGSFHDRIALLQPGLTEVGYGQSGDVVTFDIRSLIGRADGERFVQWPYNGMKKVPTHYTSELRDPLPDVKEREWGYPITLQVFRGPETPGGAVEIELFKGNPTRGKLVECHAVQLPDVYGLIPKEPLEKGQYTVRATFVETKKRLLWKFKT